MKKVATIEARMTSSRLPGKVLLEACGRPLLELMIERVRKSRLLDDIMVATTVNSEDDPIVELCRRIGCKFYRGSEDDVLLRVLEAAKSINTDLIVELTGDCPCIDWRHIDRLIEVYDSNEYDFVANNTVPSFPDGFDVRIFSTESLDVINSTTTDPWDHEHVSIFYPNHKEQYNCYNWYAPDNVCRPSYAVTLDEEGDYILIKSVFEALLPENNDFSCVDVVNYLDSNPKLLESIRDIKRTKL